LAEKDTLSGGSVTPLFLSQDTMAGNEKNVEDFRGGWGQYTRSVIPDQYTRSVYRISIPDVEDLGDV